MTNYVVFDMNRISSLKPCWHMKNHGRTTSWSHLTLNEQLQHRNVSDPRDIKTLIGKYTICIQYEE